MEPLHILHILFNYYLLLYVIKDILELLGIALPSCFCYKLVYTAHCPSNSKLSGNTKFKLFKMFTIKTHIILMGRKVIIFFWTAIGSSWSWNIYLFVLPCGLQNFAVKNYRGSRHKLCRLYMDCFFAGAKLNSFIPSSSP